MILDEVLNTIENEDIRKFADKCVATIPEYWYHVWASSTGKFHPAYTVCDGGLAKHTVALIRILNHIFGVESISTQFTSRERDLLRVAGIMHDTRKSGNQEDYERSKWSRFDHPLQAAAVIREIDGLPKDEIELIAHTIESHMGAWNTDKRSSIVLPKPEDKYQIILHLADYLASRKDITIEFDNDAVPETPAPDIMTWKIDFGKHRGKTLVEVEALDPDYFRWAKENITREPARTLLATM